MLADAQRSQYAEQGFFIADDAVDPNMLEELAVAGPQAADKHRADAVVVAEDGVKVGDGTPNDEGTGNIEGVLAPEYGEPAFAEYLASDPLLNYAMCDALPERLQRYYDRWWEVQPPEEEVAA